MKKTILIALLLAQTLKAETTLSLIGITAHGYDVSPLASEMPNKIDTNASAILNPQITLTNHFDNGLTISGSVLMDCFSRTAYNLSIGKHGQITKNVKFVSVMGLYVRKSAYEVKLPDFLRHANYDYIPMPMIGFSWNGPEIGEYVGLDSKTKLNVSIYSNYIINHLTFGLSF